MTTKKSNKESDQITPFVLKPKKPTSAWIYFNTATVAKLKIEKKLDQKEAFAKSAEIWKTLSDEDKKPHQAKSKADEERYKRQLKELEDNGFFLTEDGVKSTDLHVDPKKKYGQDCVVPKKPLSAYLFYTTENVNKIKEADNCTHPDAMKKCGALWNALQGDDKQKYEKLHDGDVKRYQGQMDHLDKDGFFMMDDGTKSSDHKAKLKKRTKKSTDKAAGKGAKKQKKDE